MIAFVVIFISAAFLFAMFVAAINRDKIMKKLSEPKLPKAPKTPKPEKTKEEKSSKPKVIFEKRTDSNLDAPKPIIEKYIKEPEDNSQENYTTDSNNYDDDDDFEEFRREHSILYGGGKTIAETIQDLPEDIKALLITGALQRKDDE